MENLLSQSCLKDNLITLSWEFFGCTSFPFLHPYNNHKFDFWSLLCVFLGYSDDQLGYLCFDKIANKIFVARHCKFIEDLFCFGDNQYGVNNSSNKVDINTWLQIPYPKSNNTSEAQIAVTFSTSMLHTMDSSSPSLVAHLVDPALVNTGRQIGPLLICDFSIVYHCQGQ